MPGDRRIATRRDRAHHSRLSGKARALARFLVSWQGALTLDMGLVFGIMGGAVLLFLSGAVRIDVVALLTLALLAISGLVTPAEALSGFSSPAVVTVWSVFILSGGLARTGVAGSVGHHMLRVAGKGEMRLLLAIMLTAGVSSAFINTVGVVALFLPVVMDISRSLGIPPARLLIPLSYSALLGGMTTLIGTPPNILIADALRERGLAPFRIFDFSPVGLAVAGTGILFMALVGRRLLPERDPARQPPTPGGVPNGAADEGAPNGAVDLEEVYDLREQLFALRVQQGSVLDGKPLAECRLGSAFGLHVVAVLRGRETVPAPGPDLVLRAGDRLVVQGRPEQLAEMRSRRQLLVPEESLALERVGSGPIHLAEALVEPGCPFAGRTLSEIDFRIRFAVNVLAVIRDGVPRRDRLDLVRLREGDRLVVQGAPDLIGLLRSQPGFRVEEPEGAELARLQRHLLAVRVPPGSPLAGKTLAETRLGDAFGLTVLAIVRGGVAHAAPDPEEPLSEGDVLLLEGEPRDLDTIRGIRELAVEREGVPSLRELSDPRVGLVEAVLSPHTGLAGKTLRELHFREKYGLSVLAILREGRVHRAELRDMPLRFGDAFLLYGPAERLRMLGAEPDFIVLTRAAEKPVRRERAPVALLILAVALASILAGLVPLAIGTVAGAALMVLSGCLTMEEAYRDIEWPAVFMIAGLLPLGTALQGTGAGQLLADAVIGAVTDLGPRPVLASVFLLGSLGAQIIPPAALAVLMAPVVLSAAGTTGISPHSLMMTLAMGASSCFMSPASHPANWLVVGPGGYRPTDFVRTGLPLWLLVFAVVVLVVPVFWPPLP